MNSAHFTIADYEKAKVQQAEKEHANDINVNWPERFASFALGGYLLYSGIKNLFSSPLSSLTETLTGAYILSRGITGNCSIYEKLGKDSTNTDAVNIRTKFIVDKPREDVYKFWRQLENLPLFMDHLENVVQEDATHSHWVVKIPKTSQTFSFDAEIVKDEEGYHIGWRSIEGSPINHAGKVEFLDAPGNATELDVVLSYHSPLGGFGTSLAKLMNPVFEKIIRDDIQNFKLFIESTRTASRPI